MSEEADDSALEARIEAHCADFEALLDERITAPDGLRDLLYGAARALIATCEAPVYIVPISATRYALAVRGREVVTVKINGQTIYEVEGAGLRRTVSQEGLKAALGDAILEALPIFVHAAFAGEREAT